MKQITLITPSGYFRKIFGRAKTTISILTLLLTAQWNNAQTWENVGPAENTSAGGSSFNNLIIQNGSYFLSYYDLSVTKGSVQKFNGSDWSYVGETAGITTGSATYNALAIDSQGVLYYSNQIGYPGSGMEVRQYGASAWSLLPLVTSGAVNSQALITADDVVFAYNNENNGTVKRYINGAWEQVGNTGFSAGATFAEMAVSSTGTIYTCNVAGGNVQVYQHDAGTASGDWVLAGGTVVDNASGFEQYTSDIAIDSNNNLYVAYVSNSTNGQKLNVKKFDGTAWIQVGSANFSPGKVQHVAIAVTAGGTPYVVASRWENDNMLKNTAYKFDADTNTWSTYGGEYISNGQATYNDIAIDEANHYLVLAYSQSGTKVKRIAIPEDTAPQTPICNGTEPGNNTGDIGCVSFTYMGEVVSYATVRGADGNIWLQQNLGSTGIATAMNDETAYGDLFQWGRWADGHQKRDSEIRTTATEPNNPAGATQAVNQFIASSPSWWNTRQLSDTWSAQSRDQVTETDGCDPCKALGQGWQLPTQQDWINLVSAERITNMATGYASNLKLPATGYRSNTTGEFTYVGERGYYWSSGTSNTGGRFVYLSGGIVTPTSGAPRGQGAAIRCVKLAPQIIPVTSVTINVQDNADPDITILNGTLQLTAAVLPSNANQNVTWSVTSGSESGTVSTTGLVTATANGSITVRATSIEDTTKFTEIVVNASAQERSGITGFNYDIIANGIGNAAESSQLGLDEVNARALVSLDFRSTTNSAIPTYGLPVNGIINSANTPGVSFQLENYAAKNALYLTPSYVTGSANSTNTGTLSFEAQNAGTVYILSSAAGGGSNNLTFNATINFTDGTTQVATVQANDWYNNSGFAIKGIGRVNRANNNLEGDFENPRLYENSIVITNENIGKTISGITFSFSGDASAEYGNEIRLAILSITTTQGQVNPVEDVITIETSGNVPATITTSSGTLALTAYLNGVYASDSDVTWSIVDGGTGSASVDMYGRVTASGNGTVVVRATLNSNTDVYGEIEVTITNQSAGYCEAYFINGCAPMSINSVTTTGGSTNINNTASGCSNDNGLTGYGDFTAQAVTASPGDTVSFNLNYSANSAYLSVWIDWNHDFIFADSERVYFTGNAEAQSRTAFTVTVPQDAALTATRIRIKAVNGWEGSGPCGYNSFGEVEDYTFTIVEGTTVNPESVTITTDGGIPATITTENTTLQLVAVVAPANAPQDVIWTVVPGTGTATVDENGVVTPVANGTVIIRATSPGNPSVYTEIEITIDVENLGAGTTIKNSFTIYPNPTGGDITIASSEPVRSVIIYNQLGQLVKTACTAVISMQELPAGVYMVEVRLENNAKSVQKVIRR
ncbi:MAG: GEVED domain-containing protein [Bacteroidia bacterium]